uniref:Shikimate kinase n=1 Tax=Dictyoglomus thermophilum TaxID=14 RepID=A0A7C3MHV6_DICTH
MNINRIALIGFMGSGKTTVGLFLSKELSYPFIDLDCYIEEKEGEKITKIFSDKGEDYFRERESFYLNKVIEDYEKVIISTGGGIILKEENRKLLKEKSFVIYLYSNFDTLINRLQKEEEFEKRPILKRDIKEVKEIYEMRQKYYRETAHLILDTEGKNPNLIVKEIVKGLQAYGKV